ncbi:MAG: hypothetical protein AAB364_01805 [Patescibacteria group bacterium]
MTVSTNRKTTNARQTVLTRILVALLVLCLVAVAYLYQRYRTLQTDPEIRAKNETTKIIKSLARLMIIPDETGVVVATVSDREKLNGQDFFRSAQNGDKVIVFPQAHLAVLYRPAVDKIVTTAPLAQVQAEAENKTEQVEQHAP